MDQSLGQVLGIQRNKSGSPPAKREKGMKPNTYDSTMPEELWDPATGEEFILQVMSFTVIYSVELT